MKEKEGNKKGIINMELSTFELPPSGDVLVIGKRCPIGPEAAKRMLESVAPNKFEFIQIKDEVIDSIFVKKHLFLRADREKLVNAIVEEAKEVMGEECMLRIKCDVKVMVRREI